jgi:O-acetyl-ADP-ribose deacetylase (regulator of RNase III)
VEPGRKISIAIQYGDIADAREDVIVNAANSMLEHGGGVAGALSQAAGPVLQKESRNLVKKYDRIQVGESVITSPGSLNAKFVIHTVGPTLEEYQDDPYLLQRAFTSALQAADSVMARTVAMPLISSGKPLFV